MNKSDLFVQTKLVNGEMLVIESIIDTDVENEYTPAGAKNRALAIMQACAYAESEAIVVKSLVSNKIDLGHFDLKPMQDLLLLIRKNRQPLREGIAAIYGFRTQKPLVNLTFSSGIISLHVDDARRHANILLEASEAALSDQFLLFLADGDKQMWSQMMETLQLFRKQFDLESLFKET